jgi:hypothetical protein
MAALDLFIVLLTSTLLCVLPPALSLDHRESDCGGLRGSEIEERAYSR